MTLVIAVAFILGGVLGAAAAAVYCRGRTQRATLQAQLDKMSEKLAELEEQVWWKPKGREDDTLEIGRNVVPIQPWKARSS